MPHSRLAPLGLTKDDLGARLTDSVLELTLPKRREFAARFAAERLLFT